MATGKKPFGGDSTVSTLSAILRDEPRDIVELNPALPRHLGRIVQRCLAKDPSRRYQTALDVRNELESLDRESDASAGTGTPVQEPARPRRGKRGPLVGVAAVAILAAVAAIVLLRPEQPAAPPAEPAAEAEPPSIAATGLPVLAARRRSERQ